MVPRGPKKACIVYGVTILSPFTKILTNCITKCILIMIITKHAFKRMTERGLSPEMLSSMMKGHVVVKPSRNGSFIVIGRADGNFWTVLMGSDLYTVITVRRSHSDEESLWNLR